jgi:hypothetical protein
LSFCKGKSHKREGDGGCSRQLYWGEHLDSHERKWEYERENCTNLNFAFVSFTEYFRPI